MPITVPPREETLSQGLSRPRDELARTSMSCLVLLQLPALTTPDRVLSAALHAPRAPKRPAARDRHPRVPGAHIQAGDLGGDARVRSSSANAARIPLGPISSELCQERGPPDARSCAGRYRSTTDRALTAQGGPLHVPPPAPHHARPVRGTPLCADWRPVRRGRARRRVRLEREAAGGSDQCLGRGGRRGRQVGRAEVCLVNL